MSKDPDVVAEAVKALGAGPAAQEAYRDILQPAAREIGKDLVTVARVVHIAMGPLRGAVWSYDKVSEWLSITLTRKLARSKPENIDTPSMTIAGPILLHLPFCKDDETLKELFSNLLASSMDAATKDEAHPSFVYIIQQLSNDEAKLLYYLRRSVMNNDKPLLSERRARWEGSMWSVTSPELHSAFRDLVQQAGCRATANYSAYLDNLLRLKILEIRSSSELVKDYNVRDEYTTGMEEKRDLMLTDFGFAFLRVCVEGPGQAGSGE